MGLALLFGQLSKPIKGADLIVGVPGEMSSRVGIGLDLGHTHLDSSQQPSLQQSLQPSQQQSLQPSQQPNQHRPRLASSVL